MSGERAKRARHYEGCTNSSWCGIYIYLEHGVTKYAILTGPLRESISLRITPFST